VKTVIFIGMSKENIWGPIIYDAPEEEDDPIRIMINRVEKIRSSLPMENGETMDEYKERKAKLINELEHKISDAVTKKKVRKLFK